MLKKSFKFISVAIAAGTLLAGCGSNISHTLQTSANDPGLWAGVMTTAEKGIAVGDGKKVRYTSDGGKTWTAGTNECQVLFALYALDSENCYACGDHSAFTKTSDGGKTWTKLSDFPLKRAKGIHMNDSESAWVWGLRDLYQYNVKDSSWQKINLPEGLNAVEAAAKVSEQAGYLCGGDGCIYKTEDNGKNWTKLCQVFDKKADELKPVTAQWTQTAAFDLSGEELRFAYITDLNYSYTVRVLKSLDGGNSFAEEAALKMNSFSKALVFNRTKGLCVFDSDGKMDLYQIK